MAHSCRWRFPARPGGSCNSGTGRRAGRIRVTASLRSVSGAAGLGPGFDAALQVSSVIGSNLQKFRDVLGESTDSSSGEEEAFGGFGPVAEQKRIQSPSTTPLGLPIQEKKPRGRPPRALTAQKAAACLPSPSSLPSPTQAKPEGPERPAEKVKRLPGRPPGTGEKRRGRPPSSSSKKAWSTGSHAAGEDSRQDGSEVGMETEEDKDRKGAKRTPLGSAQPHGTEAKLPKGGRGESKVTTLKRLRATKLSPLKSRLKTLPGVPRRRRGRPPSAERLKAEAAAAAAATAAAQLSTSIECEEGKHKAFRVRGGDRGTEPHTPQHGLLRSVDGAEYQDSSDPPASPSPSKPGKVVGLRKSPRHRKPVRIVPSSKRTDAAIAKQLLQRAKKGAQKRLEKEAVAIGGSGTRAVDSGIRKTQLKNIRQFIMPVVSTVSLRIIKTPKRFIEDEGNFGTPPPHMKIARLETTPSSVSTSAQPTSTTSSSPSPVLVSSTPAVTSTGTTAPIDSLPPPPPPPPAPLPTAPSTTASLLNNNNTNNAANGRFSSSAASCGSSAVSQHSSQLSSAESSRSSSPSLDDSSCDSQASEATQALSEPEDHSLSSQGEREANLLHSSRPPSPPSEPEPERVLAERSRRGRRGQGVGRGSQSQRARETLTTGAKKPIISPPTGVLMSSSTLVNSQQASSTASSSSSPPPPPLLTPPQPPQSASSNTAAISEHHSQSPWISHPIPPFLSGPSVLSSLSDKRSRSILREPTFRWTSLSHPEQQYFSSAKYAKEGLIRKPIFDNFRPPPLTAEDVGLLPHGVSGAGGAAPGVFPASGSGAGTGTRLFAPHHQHTHHQQHPSSSRFDAPHQKRSPLLRAPRFTPSEAHSRIFESVTLHSSSGSSPGSLSPHQTSSSSNRTSRRRRRLVSGIIRGHPRSPSHSMTRRSSQMGGPMSMGKGSSEMSVLTGSVPCCNPSSLPGASASPIATSALTPPFSTFSTVSMGLAPQGTPDGRRGAIGNPPPLSTTSSTSSPLFPLFPSSAQDTGRGAGKGGKEKTSSAPQEPAQKEKERDLEKNREKEKENKREGRKDLEKRSKVSTPDGSPNAPSSLFTVDGRDSEDALLSIAPKKAPGRKKSTSVDTVSDTASSDVRGPHSTVPISIAKGRLSKKNRPSEKGAEVEDGEKEKEKQSAPSQQTASLPGQPGRQQLPVSSLGSMLAQAEKQPVTDKRVVGLLKKAKAQLFAIKKSKLKPAEQTKVQSQESDSSEASVRGPRIKHVCRRAAVALGRNRAVFPDDMPTLSALPWEEREKILSSMGNDDKSSVAGSEEAEPQSPPIKPRETRQKAVQEAPPKKGRRSRRCGQCSGCQVPEDCGVCTNCLDKPKFGGRNIKKQCCKMRKCQNLQWMPSKMFLQKQGKCKKDKKKNKSSEKKDSLVPVKVMVSESGPKPASAPLKEEPPRKKSETPPLKLGEEKSRLQPLSKQSSPALASSPAPVEPLQGPGAAQSPGLTPDAKPLSATSSVTSKKGHKPQPSVPTSSSSSSSSSSSTSSSASSSSSSSPSSSAQNSPSQSTQSHQPSQQQQRPLTSQAPSKKDASPKISLCEPKKKPQQHSSLQQSSTTTISDIVESKQLKKPTSRSIPPSPKQRPKDKPLSTKPPSSSTLNWLSTPSTRGQAKSRAPCDGVHRIRVDFKRDLDVEKVWEAGGLSLLTSVPVTPRVLCYLCASSGNVEFVFCQVCCEPFHLFCLGESERPLQEQFENWCCRRCRFCQACGRQHQKTKQQLLECDKCRNSYHPECLGPNHPTRPTKKKRVWVCTKCVRCKSCGATKPGKSWDAQWSHDFSMCHDCAKLFAKGNFCPLCDKCYDDDDYDSKMMECGRCNHWVHAKCENLTDEMYELLSKLPESVAYTCTKCTERHPAEWRTALERELQGCVRHVLTALLNSRTSSHLLRYKQAVKPPELNPETEESLPSRRSPEGPDPPVLTEVPVTPPTDSPPDLESVDKKMDQGRYNSVLEFSDDITRIIQTAINSDGGQPESRKANSMVKSFFIRQMDRIFPWFKVKESRLWERQKVSSNGLLPNAVLPPSLDHNYAQWQERQELSRAELPHLMKKIIPAPRPKTPGEPDSPASPSPSLPPSLPPPPPLLPDRDDSPELPPPPGISDNRQCVLCLKYGDENTNDGGRLLYIGQNEWTHVNCALWSAEVFEDDDGSLKNVHMAVLRGKQLRCEKCQKPGATVGCCLTSCTSNYHFMCARQCHCVFLEDKKVYCPKHKDLIKGEVVSGFEVTRRILVDLEGIRLRRKWLAGLEPENVHMMIGSMTIDCLGILTELSDCKRKLFPVGYQCSRVYWSTSDARKRCVYTCRILVCHPPVVESDLRNMMAPEENRTITHSPPPIADFPDPFESPRRSDTLSPANTPKLRVYTRNRHPSYPPCQRSLGPRPMPSPGGTSQPQSHEIVTVGDSLVNPSLRNIDSRRHSSPSLSPPPHQLNRQRVVTSSPQVVSRPLTSPPPLIPSPARDPEKSKHLSKESAKGPVQREDEKGRLFSTDRNRHQTNKDQGLRDADKGRASSQDQASKDSDKNRSSRELGQKDSDKGEISAKEPEKRRPLSKDLGVKESERRRPPSRDSEKGRQVNRDSEKGRQTSRDSSNSVTDRSKSSSRNPNYKDIEKARSLSRDAGLRDTEKQRQHCRETGKDSGPGKDRPSSRDSDKGRPPSRESSYRSTEKNKDSGSGKDNNLGSQSKQTGGESKSPRLAPAGSGQSSPPAGNAVLTGQQRGGSTKQTDKQGKHGGKDQDVSASVLPRHRATPTSNITQSKDKPSSGKESSSGGTGNVMPASLHKDSVVGKSGSPQSSFQKSTSRKSNDYSSGPATAAAAAMKPVWPSRTPAEDDVAKRGSMHPASTAAASAAKEKHPKIKTAGSRELPKDREREKTFQNSNSSNKIPPLNNNTKATGSANAHATNPSSHNSTNSKALLLGNSTKAHGKAQGEKLESQGGDRSVSKSRENYSCPERKNSSGLDSLQQLQPAGLAPEKGAKIASQSHTKTTTTNQLPLSTREKKRSVKPPAVTPLKTDIKTDPNGTSTVGGISSSCPTTTTSTVPPAGQGTRRSARSALFSSPSASSSDSSESDTRTQMEEEDLRKEHSLSELRDHHSLLTQGTEDEGDGPEDDRDRGMDDKHHEDDSDGSGSAKRRYPRRSARARSNMFFGLTPFYGVRSYGEEDLPFYGSGDGAGAVVKKRTGGRKKSAEGQVDGADDMSTSSSSGDSGEDEDSAMKQRGKDPYYYNFTRTIINPGEALPSIEGIDRCLGRGSQLQRFLKDEEQQQQRAQGKAEEDMLSALTLGKQRIGQLDGVDDGSESDTSVCTTSTTTTTTATSSSTPHKSAPKRRGRERHTEKPDAHDSSKEADNSGGAVSGNTREGRKNQKENCLPLGGGVKSQPQSQGQDPLEAQLSLSTDLLKSDSDNNNSDDCGNILPSDIMEFVLNTPSMSMQALGQQSEPSSSELLLDEGYVGVDVNRPKDILFDDFSQQLPSAESGAVVESSVNSSISVEEPYLPLELPSDLSVLTTRSPSVNASQNHTAGSLISDTSDRTMLGLTSDPETIRGEKSGDKKRAGPGVSPSESQHEATTLGNRDTQVTEGHMTPEQFIPSPSIGQVVEPPGNQDVPRSSGTPGLPSSPSLPLQGQKYIPASAAAAGSPCTVPGPGPSQTQVSSPAVLKPGPDKLIVVNQQFQPLYVLQTVPNGVAQKMSAAGVLDSSSSAVLSSMTLTTGLNTALSTAQSIFPAGGKVLGTMAHPSQIHTFTGATQTGFQTGIPSTTSGLLIGLPHDQSQILVSEAGRPHELGPGVAIMSSPSSQTVLASAHGKKRPISRLQPRKSKKLARSRSQPTLAPSEVGPPNMTLINLSSPQITASISGQPGGLVSTSQRKVPNIIKRPTSGGVMYLDPTTLLQQRISGPGQPGILGCDSSTHLIPCTVSGLNSSQSVLNVVSVASSGATGLLAPGTVSLSTPVLSSTEITGPISSLLFKAGPHGLGLQSAGGPLISHISSSVQTCIASSICVLPSQQTFSMAVNRQGETEVSNIHLQHHSQHINRAQTLDSSPHTTVTLATSLSPANRRVVGVFTQTQTSAHSQSSRTTPISRSSEQRPPNSTTLRAEKGKPKSKRSRQSPDITSVKKLKASQTEEHQSNPAGRHHSKPSSKELSSSEPMDTGKPADKATSKSVLGKKKTSESPVLPGKVVGKDKPSADGGAGSLPVASPPDQDGNSRDTGLDSKPKKGIIFEICSEDGFHIRCESIEEAWKSLTDKVQEARSNARLKELSFEGVNGLRMLGVVHEAVVFLLEQLYGSRHCRSYRFRFHKPEETDEPPINPHGSARAEIHHRRSVFDMFNFLASKHRQPPEYRPQEDDDDEGQLRTARRASMELPLAVRFKQLKATSKETVGVYRSPIHGRGLFCKKTIDAAEMVIEYSGNVIRSVLTDKREKYYDGKGIGCYMFRIDDYEVVDATVHGNAARFINHSCEPNCYSRVITVDGLKHIVILASRRIYCGEELTYDYKFPIEDASNKLPCNCGAKKCRKFLN
ncbi:histone-lysine N-methyltransferase 2A isoform X2 [Anarrhichthys ocellatus]|uniref:histone-lysine N-methyltransferase 2A isoform X2 n=1 Tax=Anarrhichthys ocellatus TaxID=433405 RepID=UPI0012ED36B2|nr:histone-lysine N-methyltransferase 2A isoform X2 [Anarrhichthys ocellatus]